LAHKRRLEEVRLVARSKHGAVVKIPTFVVPVIIVRYIAPYILVAFAVLVIEVDKLFADHVPQLVG
jgi:hypothetical protein